MKRFLYFALALMLLQMFGCGKSPTAPASNPVAHVIVPVVISATFQPPEINLHDTTLTVVVLWSIEGTYDSIRYQTQIGVIVDSVTTVWGRIINDTLLIVEHPSPIPAFSDSIDVLARCNYWTPKGEFWYNKYERVACITVNRP